MARNALQFQEGLSELAFQEKFGKEAQCETVLQTMRRTDGCGCPECGTTKGHRPGSRNLYQYASCIRHTTVTAGTNFEPTRLPLSLWFRSMYHLTLSKNGVLSFLLLRSKGLTRLSRS